MSKTFSTIKIEPEQIVQDLIWVIGIPSLLVATVLNEVQLKPLSEKQLLRINQLGPLELKSRKLGNYFELLIKRYVEVCDDLTLKASNLQVQHNKKTYGEFDIIIEDVAEEKHYFHWEVSIKFYWCHNPELGLNGCCGTRYRDVFRDKVHKMAHQQLVLSNTREGKMALSEIGVSDIKAGGILKGMVFYHQKLGAFDEVVVNPFLRKGIWMYHSEWKDKTKGQFIVLKKPFLFSLCSYKEAAIIYADEVGRLAKECGQAIMLAKIRQEFGQITELMRYWLMPDDW